MSKISILNEGFKQVSHDSYIIHNTNELKKALEDYIIEFNDDDKREMLNNIEDEPKDYPCFIMVTTPDYPYNRILVKSISIEELQKHLM